MPIKLRCPKCDASIKARDSEAGERIECPECEVMVRVPSATPERSKRRDDDEETDRPRKKSKANYDEDEDDVRPRKKSKVNNDEDDDDRPRRKSKANYDDDDEDDRPRRNKPKRKKQQSKRGLMMGLVVGGSLFLLLLLVGGGILVYQLMKPKPDKVINGEDWYKVEDADNILTAYFPGNRPEFEKFGLEPSAFLAKKAGQKAEDLSFGTKSWIRKDDGREYSILLMKLPAGDGPNAAEQAFANSPRFPPGQGVTVLLQDEVSLGTHPARRLVAQRGNKSQVSLMAGIGNRHVILVMVTGDKNVNHNDPKVKTFFENLTIKQ